MTCFRIGNETLHQYCKRTGLNYKTIWLRLENGLTPDEAVKEPMKRKNNVKYLINGKSARSQMTINEYQLYRKRILSAQR